MDEKMLVEQAVRGNPDAFCELYGLYKDRLYKYAYYKLKDPVSAEDAVSECVVSAWKGVGSLRNAEAFSSWIFRILSTHCANQIKNTINERENLELIYRGSNQAVSDTTLSLELSEALDRLEIDDRDILLLSVIAGLKSREIASMYGLTAGSVRSRLSRTLHKMKKYLEVQA